MERNTIINRIKSRFKGFILGAFLVLLTFGIQAQSLEVGIFGGGSYYLGELNPGLPFANTKPAFGVSARYSNSSRWSFKLSYIRGQVSGSDDQFSGVVNRDLGFNTTINDVALVAEFSFWEYFTGSKNNFFSPYLFGGIGFFTFTPKSLDGQKLQPLGTEGQNIGFEGRSPYNQFSVSVPFGIGAKYSLSKRFGLNFEWGMRKTFTDYIDDVSTTYYLDGSTINPTNTEEVLSDPTLSHNPGMQRGDEKNFDWVSYAGVTLSYKMDLYSKKRCDNLKW
jgi:hypothetical protein